jgi:hypothetical protein
MRLRIHSHALINLLLAAAVLAAGLPGIVSNFRRLPVEATVQRVRSGQSVSRADLTDAIPPLESASALSAAAKADLALVLLTEAANDPAGQADPRLKRAAQELQGYLAEVPGDSVTWAALSDAEYLQGLRKEAADSLKMSILTGPWLPSLVLYRCGMGLDLYLVLDEEGRGLLRSQFRNAMERSPAAATKLALQRKAVPLVRRLLNQSPEALGKFEAELPRSQ